MRLPRHRRFSQPPRPCAGHTTAPGDFTPLCPPSVSRSTLGLSAGAEHGCSSRWKVPSGHVPSLQKTPCYEQRLQLSWECWKARASLTRSDSIPQLWDKQQGETSVLICTLFTIYARETMLKIYPHALQCAQQTRLLSVD